MRYLACVIAIFLLSRSVGAVAASSGLCLPQTRSQNIQDWPICAVYMHGLFGSPPYSPAIWEVPFRAKFEKVALEKKCRIAVPFGNQGKYRNWNSVSLPEILARARHVCSQAPFSDHPDVIGFSNGANRLRRMGAGDCHSLAQFTQVTLIGPTGTANNARVRKCGNVRIHQAHEAPPLSYLMEAVTYESREAGE